MGLWHHRVITRRSKSYVREKFQFPAFLLSKNIDINPSAGLGLLSAAYTPYKPYQKNLYQKDNISVAVDGNLLHLNHNSNMGAYVHRLYQTYGKKGFDGLEGAFSLVLYDEKRQLTLLYRSLLAGNPLYFVAKNNLLSVSTNPVYLLHRSDVSDTLNHTEMSALFAFDFSGTKGNVFSELTEVKSGEIVTITPEGIEHSKRPLSEILKPQKYGSQLEIIEKYRTMIEQVVHKSLLPDVKHGIMLSSGMDSSTVAVFAKQQLEKEKRTLTAYSWTLPNDPKGDESVRIKELCQTLGIPLKLFNGERFGTFDAPDTFLLLPDTPYTNPYWLINAETYRHASNDGIGAILNGGYGDMLYRGQNDILIDIVKDLRLELFLPEIYTIVKKTDYANTLRKLIPDALLKYLRKTDVSKKSPWLSESARASRNLMFQEKIDRVSERMFDRYALALSPYQGGYLGVERYLSGQYSIKRIDPFVNLELVHYTLGIPTYMTYRKGKTKYFAREAMRGLLPESIRLQPRVGLLTQLLHDSYDRNKKAIRERIMDDRKVWKKYVDESWMERKLNLSATQDPFDLMVFWLSLNLQAWQKAIRPGGSLYEGKFDSVVNRRSPNDRV